MLKNKTKLIIAILTILLLISTITFATNDDAASISSEGNVVSTVPGDNAKTEENAESTETPEIRDTDLYLFNDNIVMDQLIDGNVFLFGNNIEITGKVNGSLYVFGNKVTFKSGSYVVNTIYACANEIYFEGDANDLYVVCNTLNMSYDSFIVRDLRVCAGNFTFSGGVGRNAYVTADNFTFTTEEENDGIIFGDLNYSSKSELELSKDFVQGDLNYTEITATSYESTTQDIIIDKITDLLISLFTTIIVFLLILWLAPKFMDKSSSFVSSKTLPAFGIGLLGLIIVPIVAILLMCSTIGISIAFAALGLYVSILLIATSVVNICITNKIKEKFNFDKKYKTVLTLIATSIVVWALKQIPYVGGFIGFILFTIGIGIIVMYLFTKNKKIETKTEESPVKE